jgi:hypothetical protein
LFMAGPRTVARPSRDMRLGLAPPESKRALSLSFEQRREPRSGFFVASWPNLVAQYRCPTRSRVFWRPVESPASKQSNGMPARQRARWPRQRLPASC